MRLDSIAEIPPEIHDITHLSFPAPKADSAVYLPLEIHDLILDHLSLPAPTTWDDRDSPQSVNDRATLRAYSMVSRTPCVAAHSRLFSSVILRVKAFSRIRNTRLVASATRRFIALLQDSLNFPNLGMIYHLRSFALTIQIDCNLRQAYNFLRDATIHRLIDALHGPNHGVESLALNMSYGKSEHEEITISHDLLRAFHHILRCPKLIHLRLDGLIGLPGILFHGTNLRILEVYNTQIEQDGNKLDAPLITAMESIGVDGSFHLVDLLHLGNDSIDTTSRYQAAFVKLKAFYFLVNMVEEIPKAINIAVKAANTLHTLHIHLFGNWLEQKFDKPRSPNPKYPFHLLPKLSSLRLSSKKIGLDSDSLIYPFRCILESCTVPQSLRTLSVETMASDVSYPHPDEWLALDSVLLQPIFDSVLKTSIVIEFPFYHSAGYNSYDDADLQRYIKTGILNVLPSFSKSKRDDSQRCLNLDIAIKRFNGKTSRYRNQDQSDPKELILKCGGRKELCIPGGP